MEESAEPKQRDGGTHGPKAGKVRVPHHGREGPTKPAPENDGRKEEDRGNGSEVHDGSEKNDCREKASTSREIPGPTPPRPRQKKKGFTDRQCTMLADYFTTQISTRSFPTTVECREFMAVYKTEFQDRSPKDIYDKCRNLAGRK